MANASITTESSILGDSDAEALNVVNSVFALASDRTVANALWFKNSNNQHLLQPEFQLCPQHCDRKWPKLILISFQCLPNQQLIFH